MASSLCLQIYLELGSEADGSPILSSNGPAGEGEGPTPEVRGLKDLAFSLQELQCGCCLILMLTKMLKVNAKTSLGLNLLIYQNI